MGRLGQSSRFTNLAIFLLVGFTGLSFLANTRFLFSLHNNAPASVPRSIQEVVTHTDDHTNLTHLIIVLGHSVWNGWSPERRGDESDWVLEPAQKLVAAATVKAFWSHIVKGAELVLEDESSLLVFSGGQTRATMPHLSEAASYVALAYKSNVFQSNFLPHPRVTTEDYSLDSYQNLIFSIARFHEVVGRYPAKITIIGFGAKRARFTELHGNAIRWPLRPEMWNYIGLDLEGDGNINDAAIAGEREYGYKPFTKDLYGCHSFLLNKRKRRNPHSRYHPFHSSAPELRSLLEWCPTDGVQLFRGPLPWYLDGEYSEE